MQYLSLLVGTMIRRLLSSMRICTGEDSDTGPSTDIVFSVRPDQYYTDVIARPMAGIGRKPQAGR